MTDNPHDAFFEALLSEPCSTFTPSAFYNSDGDCIQFFTSPETYRGQRIDSRVTVYRSLQNGNVIGGMVKGVKNLIKENRALALVIEDGKAPCDKVLFLALSLIDFAAGDTREVFCRSMLKQAAGLMCDLRPVLATESGEYAI